MTKKTQRIIQNGLRIKLALVAYSFMQVVPSIANEMNFVATQYHAEVAFPELFEQVQTSKVLGDYKTFVDAIPNGHPDEIVEKFHLQKNNQKFDLKRFVQENFTLPTPTEIPSVDHEESLQTHLINHWDRLVRNPVKESEYSSLVELPHPYVVPGGRFREMFYWDSYFTIVGLIASQRDELALGMIDNFAYLIDQYGFIPNGNRSYFLSRSQPPLFAATLLAYAEKHSLKSVVKYLPQLEQEYLYWMDGHAAIPTDANEGQHLIVLENGDYLNRYYGSKAQPRAEAFGKESRWASKKPLASRGDFFRNLRAVCESGWDFSSRWFKDGKSKTTTHAMDIVPVDLSSLLYQLEHTIAILHKQNNNLEKSEHYAVLAKKRQSLIHKYHFDKATGTYQDYDFRLGKHTGRVSMAMAYPLYVGAASTSEAEQVTDYLSTHFLKEGGFVTTLINTGEQWDYPNGWAPLQYIGVKGLLNYEKNSMATDVMTRWLALNEKVYTRDGKMMEKYNVVDTAVKAGGGEYPTQDGFGWTNGVDLAFYNLLKTKN